MKLPYDLKKIAIFRALQLGDMLCAIPAVRALRHQYPRAEITLIGLPWAFDFVNRFSTYFDRFISFPGYQGLPGQSYNEEAFNKFAAEVERENFELILQMHGNGTIVNQMIMSLKAKIVAGFHNHESYVHNNLFLEYPNHGSEIERHLLLINHLGISPRGKSLEFPLQNEDYKELEEMKLPIEAKKYICIHPGPRITNEQWPAEHFAALADFCVRKKYKVVLTGTKEERSITKQVLHHSKYPHIDLAGKISWGAVGVLLSNASLLVADCTGVSQIASALETPSIIVNMDGEPERWAPINQEMHRIVDWTKNRQLGTVYLEMVSLIQQLEAKKVLYSTS